VLLLVYFMEYIKHCWTKRLRRGHSFMCPQTGDRQPNSRAGLFGVFRPNGHHAPCGHACRPRDFLNGPLADIAQPEVPLHGLVSGDAPSRSVPEAQHERPAVIAGFKSGNKDIGRVNFEKRRCPLPLAPGGSGCPAAIASLAADAGSQP